MTRARETRATAASVGEVGASTATPERRVGSHALSPRRPLFRVRDTHNHTHNQD